MNPPHNLREFGERLDAASSLNAALHWSLAALTTEAALAVTGGTDAPLAGMPIAVKDNIVTTVQPTTCASRLLEGYISPFDATVITRMRAAGGFVAAKTNLDEFAMGSSTEHSAFGRVHHPLDHARVPGGSSGGSAALVAAGVVRAALGSETGGSVRQPASFCGIVGIKPTYGRVSRYGLVAFGSSLDCVSTLGATVSDAARLLGVISGHDVRDATTLDRPAIAVPEAADLHGMTIGIPAEYFPPDLDPGIRAALERTIMAIQERGATIRPVSLPHTRYAVPTYYIIAPAEAAANLARYDGVRYGQRQTADPVDGVAGLYKATRGRGFGLEVRRRILVGTYVLSAGYYEAYYTQAQRVRARIAAEFAAAFASGIDLLLTPTTPTTAFRAGDNTTDPVAMYLADAFTCPVSLAGLPALSLPAGRSDGLPVGAQLIAPFGADERLLGVALGLEPALDATAEVR